MGRTHELQVKVGFELCVPTREFACLQICRNVRAASARSEKTGKTIILIAHSVEDALLLGERLLVMAPRPGRVHKEYRLPFTDLGVGNDLREVKKHKEYASTSEEILTMIWDMEEEIMGWAEDAA